MPSSATWAAVPFRFLDIVMMEPVILKAMRDEGFVIVTLDVSTEQRARITVKRDTDDPILFSRDIDSTDCPCGEWKFYFVDNVLMIPSEY